LKEKTIGQILDILFKDTNVGYTINNRQIILSGKTPVVTGIQQNKTVSGNVTDQSGFPLPGVSVVIKSTTSGTITDIDGNFSLNNVPSDAILFFSFVGMRSQEVSVAVARS
jgi:hypothetical protein